MAMRSEVDLDAAMAALAREAHDAAPRPGPDLSALVMVDAALTVLAVEAAEAAPRAHGDLVARVLSDAAEIGASRAAATAADRSAAQAAGTSRRGIWGVLAPGGVAHAGLVHILSGWRVGALACMLLGLILGLGLGLEVKTGALPVLERMQDGTTMALAGLDSEFDFVEGL